MKEVFEEYLQRLKDRRTKDSYKYTDEDFIQYEEYIKDCYNTNLSVYKCLEWMSFAEREIQPEQIWNEEKKKGVKEFIDKHKQECMITKIMQMDAEMAYDSLPKQDKIMERFIANAKQETLEQAVELFFRKKDTKNCTLYKAAKFGAKWQQERSYSEEEVLDIIRQYALEEHLITSSKPDIWFEQFKKK